MNLVVTKILLRTESNGSDGQDRLSDNLYYTTTI